MIPPSDRKKLATARGRRVGQLRALNRLGVAMSSSLNPVNIMHTVLQEARNSTDAQSATIFTVDADTQMLLPRVSAGETESRAMLDLQSSSDLAVQVAHMGRPSQEVFPCIDGCPISQDLMEDPETGSCCRLCVPLMAGDEVLGVIDLKRMDCTGIEPDTQEFLATMASQAALILRNASTHEELERHYRELSVLYEIQQEISSTLDYHRVLKLIVERTKRLMLASECTIRLIADTPTTKVMRVAATTGDAFIGPQVMPLDEALIDQQVLGGDMIAIEDVRADSRFSARDEAAQLGIVSMLCAPLIARRKVIGTIRLYTNERRDFNLSDRKMFLAVAGQAATAIDNARLYSQVELKNKELLASNVTLRKTQTELVKKEKLAALGEMAATVAHEIRNPLTSVRGFAQRIARKYGDLSDGRLGEYTSIIIEEVDRLNKFIKDVLDFARRAKPELTKVNVNVILSEIVNLMRDELTAQSIMVIPDFDMNLKETIADQTLLKQAFINIVQNARHAMNKGGILMIRTQNAGNSIRIRIADDGHGIPPEVMHRIWTPFYTTRVQGTGLGLALVSRIIDDHHGNIQLRSKPGRGTIVDIRLPITENPEELMKPSLPSTEALPAAVDGQAEPALVAAATESAVSAKGIAT